jgi:hypothetical protein
LLLACHAESAQPWPAARNPILETPVVDTPVASMTVDIGSLAIGRGETISVPRRFMRERRSGVLQVSASGVPSGIAIDDVNVQPGQEHATLLVRADAAAPLGRRTITLRFVSDGAVRAAGLALTVDAEPQFRGDRSHVILSIGRTETQLRAITRQRDGKLLVGGYAVDPRSEMYGVVARLSSSGAYDSATAGSRASRLCTT